NRLARERPARRAPRREVLSGVGRGAHCRHGRGPARLVHQPPAHLGCADRVDAWYALDLAEILGDEARDYEKVHDILDVWFDSGVTHFCVLDQRPELRRNTGDQVMYLEGSDQHRGWFQSSLLTSCAMHGHAPFDEVLTHGFTVDAQGRKMSKSLGNGIEPQDVMNRYGADILRLWIASADYRNEMALSDEILKRVADS